MGPNVVLFFLDDHARWALGCYGNSEVRTPTLDYLARTGVRMDGATTPIPVCSPARASLWTGLMPSQHGVHDYLDVWDPQVDAHDWLGGQQTLAQRLRSANYTTGMVGKWHLGRSSQPHPSFDYWYEPGTGQGPSFQTPWRGAGGLGSAAQGRHAITEHAVDFLRHTDADRPFFLFVGYVATHSPWTGHPERLVDSYRDCSFTDAPLEPVHPIGQPVAESWLPTRRDRKETLAQYYASATEVDEQVGRIVDELDDLGLRDDTLIVYTSDHGMNLGHHGLWGKGNATHPYNMLDESIQVPLIFNQGDRLLTPQIRREPVTHCDLYRTLVDIAGVDHDTTPDGVPLPGRSYARLLDGQDRVDWQDAAFGEYGTLRMVRTSRHKLILRPAPEANELYDLDADPRETRNVATDPAYADVLADLTRRVKDYFATYEVPERSGWQAAELPRHNLEEAWRNPGYVHRWWEEQ
jgi:arylsulfatase A-like enzyme